MISLRSSLRPLTLLEGLGEVLVVLGWAASLVGYGGDLGQTLQSLVATNRPVQ